MRENCACVSRARSLRWGLFRSVGPFKIQALKPQPGIATASVEIESGLPQVFGRYLLVQRLSRGGMGEIFLAKHGLAGFEKLAVIKKVLPHLAQDAQFISRFVDEAQVAIKLQHVNIAQVFEVGRVGDEYFLALEYIEGRDLRRLFSTLAQRAMQMHSLGRTPVTLIMIDLDKLKFVNDMYGHQAGDAFITGVAKAMAKVFLRQSDVICRYGGDEFSAILNNTDGKVAMTLAQRLHDQIANMASPHPALEFQVGASIGLAELDATEDVDGWIARADKALYRAKQGERICIAEPLLAKTPA